jgi:hypothetical protein
MRCCPGRGPSQLPPSGSTDPSPLPLPVPHPTAQDPTSSASGSSGGAPPSEGGASLARRSLDGHTPSRRRTTVNSLSLDGLNLDPATTPAVHPAVSGLQSKANPEDPGSFGKSRLATKWGRPTSDTHVSDGGASSSGNPPCIGEPRMSEAGSIRSEDVMVMADIKLVPATPTGAPATPGKAGAAKAAAYGADAPPKAASQDVAVRQASVKQPLPWNLEDDARRISLDVRLYDQQRTGATRAVPQQQQQQQAAPAMGLGAADLSALLSNPGGALQAVAALMQQQQMNAAQQQYASALAQVAAARDRMLQTAAALHHKAPAAGPPGMFAAHHQPVHQAPALPADVMASYLQGLMSQRSMF